MITAGLTAPYGHKYLTIIPRTQVGYELSDSGRGAEHRVGYHKLISNKREWNNCLIKYQTLDFVYIGVLKTSRLYTIIDCLKS